MHKADHELPMPPPIPNAWNASAMAMVARAEVPTRGEMAKVTAQRKESAKSMKRPMKSMKRPIAKSRLLKAARKVGRHHVRKQGESAASSSSTPGAVPQQKHDAVPQGLGDKYAALIARLPREAHPVAGKGGKESWTVRSSRNKASIQVLAERNKLWIAADSAGEAIVSGATVSFGVHGGDPAAAWRFAKAKAGF